MNFEISAILSMQTLRLLLKTGFRLTPIMKYLEYTPLDRYALNIWKNYFSYLSFFLKAFVTGVFFLSVVMC